MFALFVMLHPFIRLGLTRGEGSIGIRPQNVWLKGISAPLKVIVCALNNKTLHVVVMGLRLCLNRYSVKVKFSLRNGFIMH